MTSSLNEPTYRPTCYNCMRPEDHCYCSFIKKIDSKIMFAILIHPVEVKRKIATGRMAHLCLPNSVLIAGSNFTDNKQVNEIINNSDNHCLLLYPGPHAHNLSSKNDIKDSPQLFPKNKQTVIFVIDGTWNTAKKTMRQSENLKQLATICFTPTTPSQFRVRRQPHVFCYSTIEAIHKVLDLLDDTLEPKNSERSHDLLLTVFQKMVEKQERFCPELDKNSLHLKAHAS